MSDFPFSIPRRGDADVVNGVSYAGDTLTLTRAEGSDLTTTISTAANPFVYNQNNLNGGAYIYTVPAWDKTDTTTEIEIHAISPLNITPTSASQKVVLQVSVLGEWDGRPHDGNISLKRIVGTTETWLDSRDDTPDDRMPLNGMFTVGFHADDINSTMELCQFFFVDTPNTTAQITYKIYLKVAGGGVRISEDFYLNRTKGDLGTSDIYERAISTFTAECKG